LRKDWCKMCVKIFNQIHVKDRESSGKNKKRVLNVIRFLFVSISQMTRQRRIMRKMRNNNILTEYIDVHRSK
jgi:hypothetical protein